MRYVKRTRAWQKECSRFAWIDLHPDIYQLYAMFYSQSSYCSWIETCYYRFFHCIASICPSLRIQQMTSHICLMHPNNFTFWVCIQNLILKDLLQIHHKMASRISFFRLRIMSLKFFGAAFLWLLTHDVLPNRHLFAVRWKEPFHMLYIAVQHPKQFTTYFLKHELTETLNAFYNNSQNTFYIVFILGTRKFATSMVNR